MPVAIQNGVALHLQALGEEGKPPVVMLHGLLVGSMAAWYFTAAPALAHDHHVVLYDLRGHGLSERAKTGYDVPTMQADLAAVASRFEEPVTLVGHSYGAVVALSYALAHPERVAKLVVVEAPLPPSNLAEMGGFVGKTPEAMAESLPDVLRDALGRKGRAAARFVESLRFLGMESSLFADLGRAKDIPDEALATLAPPTLLVYGTRSSCLPVGRRIARLVPQAKLCLLEGGHFLPLERAAELTATIVEFARG